MRLLLEFLCRFGWGLALGLVATPAAVVPGGFFRVTLLVVMGLATFAALVALTAAPGGTWLLPATAAVAAWMGSVAWFGERRRAGMVLSAACAAALAAAVAVLAAGPWAMAAALVSGLVTGLTVHAMLLGHWYLNAPGMRVDALRRMIDLALMAWAAQVALAVGGLLPWRPPADAATGALLSQRWLAGLVGLPVLLVMARRTLEIPNTQSATGILYVACLAAILGELTAQLLAAAA
ncbi:MAG: hypothetical protein ACKONH_06860 [Planctomycetia bacterium]